MSCWYYSFNSLAFDDKKNNAELIKRTMECLGYEETGSSLLDEFGMEGPAWEFNWTNTTVLNYKSSEFSNEELLSLLNTLFYDISLYYVESFGSSSIDNYSGIEITYDIPTLTYTVREIGYCYGDGTAFGISAESDDLKEEGTICSKSKIQKNEIYDSISPKMVNILIENATKKGYQRLVDLVKYKIGKQNNNVINDGDTLVKAPKTAKNYVIPDSVKAIGDEALKKPTDVIIDGGTLVKGPKTAKNYVIPDSVKAIGNKAFEKLTNLISVIIPDSVTSIGDYAFEGCSSLTSITIPDRVTSIGTFVFEGCSSLTSITIPDRVREIGLGAFEGCSSLTSITIPDSVTSIRNCAFKDCSSLTSITIPDRVEEIGWRAFDGCTSLTSINVASNNKSFCIIDGALYNKKQSRLLVVPRTKANITIPNSVKIIEECAFEGCSSLTSITIPDSVTDIGYDAFKGCASLTSITIPDSVTSIVNHAFDGCSSLTSITIPDSVKEIGWSAFEGCSSLTNITIPDSVTSIESYAFSGCSSLTSINVSSNNKSFCIIDGALYNKKQSRLLVVPRTKANITIPNSVKIIELCAFEDCSSLTSITIPDSVKEIRLGAFRGCSSLTSITIPKNVRVIGQEAFYGCDALKKIAFLNPETKLLKGVFDGFPEEFYDSSPDITVNMCCSDLIKYVKFNKLSTEIQAKIVMTHKGKPINRYYSENITDKKANEIAQVMISLLNEKTTSKECDAIISFMIEFRNVLSDDSVNMMFDTLNAIPEGKKALKKCNLTNSDSIRNYID